MLSPAALSTVTKTFDGDERNKALGIWSAIGGGGAAIGVLLGGVLTAGPGWQWVFFVNVPIGRDRVRDPAEVLPADRPTQSQGPARRTGRDPGHRRLPVGRSTR